MDEEFRTINKGNAATGSDYELYDRAKAVIASHCPDNVTKRSDVLPLRSDQLSAILLRHRHFIHCCLVACCKGHFHLFIAGSHLLNYALKNLRQTISNIRILGHSLRQHVSFSVPPILLIPCLKSNPAGSTLGRKVFHQEYRNAQIPL